MIVSLEHTKLARWSTDILDALEDIEDGDARSISLAMRTLEHVSDEMDRVIRTAHVSRS